jgi:uncharacterized protein (DUF427 family)
VKIPGPDHPIAIAPHPNRVRVRVNGRVLADTTTALVLTESGYPPVFYIPRADVDMSALSPTQHRTHCPYKGDATHYAVRSGDRVVADNAAWSYERPYPAMADIAGRLAFYPRRVDAIEDIAGEADR